MTGLRRSWSGRWTSCGRFCGRTPGRAEVGLGGGGGRPDRSCLATIEGTAKVHVDEEEEKVLHEDETAPCFAGDFVAVGFLLRDDAGGFEWSACALAASRARSGGGAQLPSDQGWGDGQLRPDRGLGVPGVRQRGAAEHRRLQEGDVLLLLVVVRRGRRG